METIQNKKQRKRIQKMEKSSIICRTTSGSLIYWSLGQEDPLEKEMATYYSTLAWIIPWMVELGRLQSMGSQRVKHDLRTDQQQQGALEEEGRREEKKYLKK